MLKQMSDLIEELENITCASGEFIDVEAWVKAVEIANDLSSDLQDALI